MVLRWSPEVRHTTSSNHDIGWSHLESFLINSRPKNMFSKFWGVPIFVFCAGFCSTGGEIHQSIYTFCFAVTKFGKIQPTDGKTS